MKSGKELTGSSLDQLKENNYLPLLPTLHAILIKFLHSHNHATTAFSRIQGLLIDPSLKNSSESPFSENAVGLEILRCRLQFGECVDPEVCRFEDPPVWFNYFAGGGVLAVVATDAGEFGATVCSRGGGAIAPAAET